MERDDVKTFTIDNDSVFVHRIFDREIGREINLYPDFDLNPRYTSEGKRWVNATKDNCPFAENSYGDCGSCRHFRCQHIGDLIGICDNPAHSNRKEA